MIWMIEKSDYLIHLAILCGIYLILAQSFNLSFGFGRMLNLAHIAVYAIGAYVTALLSTELDCGFLTCVFASMTLSGFFALLLGAISLKLASDYFAVGTLAFAAIVNAVLVNWKGLTYGVLGIPGIPRPEIGAMDLNDNTNFLLLTVICVSIVLVWIAMTFQSRLARSLQALSEHEAAALSLGMNTRAIRNDSFILSSMFAGLAGSLFAYYINYIDPTSFGLSEMVFVFSIVIVGKPGSFWGVNLATVFLVLLPEPLRNIEMSPDVVGPLRQLMYALILFGVVYWKRATLFPVERTV